MTETPQAKAGPFDLVELLGRGGMGEVWRARHRPSGVPVAVKLLTGADGARRDTFHSAFANEVRLTLALDHPHVVRVLDHGTTQEGNPRFPAHTPYLVMELGPPTTLSGHLGRLRWVKIRWVLEALLCALGHAHARGVVHRDLKPSNVLADPTVSQVQLTDFGLAHALEAQPLEGARVFVGTPAYMAPEQFEGSWRDIGPWTDLYGLGCLAYALAAGIVPFPVTSLAAGRAAHLSAEPPALPEGAPVPEGFAGVLAGLLAKDPGQRFQRAADVRLALSELPDADPAALPLGRSEGEATVTLTSDAFVTESGEAFEPLLYDITATTSLLSAALAHSPRPAPTLPEDWRDDGPELPRQTLDDAGLRLVGLQSPPMVGRERERDRLWAELLEVQRSGRPGAVVLPGPTGVGKRRLARWLCERAHELGSAWVLEARHEREPGPGHGTAGMLDRLLNCTGLDRQGTLARLRQIHSGLGVEDPELALGLLDVMRSEEGPLDVEDPTQASAQRFSSVITFLRRLGASGRPMVVVLDEAQWGSEPVDFAHALLEGLDAPVLVLLTVTPDLVDDPEVDQRLAALPTLEGVSSMPIRPLGGDEIDVLLSWYGLSETLAGQVRERAAGNPMFAVQLLGGWVERGLLESTPEGLVLSRPVDEVLPRDLRQVWLRRLDEVLEGLDAAEGVALERAAVLGPAVAHDDWDAVCRPGGAPMLLLGRLMDRQLAHPVGPKLGGGWAFAHPMLREALLVRAQEAGRLQGHHEACVMWLAGRPGPGVAQRLARHLLGAGRPREALGPLLQAARERRMSGDTPGALGLLVRRDQTLEQLRVPVHDPRWAPSWLERARVHRRRCEYDAMESCLDRVAEVARSGSAVAISAELAWAAELRRQGRYHEAVPIQRRCSEQAEALGNRRLQAMASWSLARTLLPMGRLDEAEELCRTALVGFEELDDRLGRWRVHKALGEVGLQRGDLKAARGHLRRAITQARSMGYAWGRATSLLSLGDVERYAGQLERAVTSYRSAADVFRRCGALGSLAYADHNLALTALQERNLAQARAAFRAADAVARSGGDRPLLADIQVGLAVCALAEGDTSAADRYLVEARELYGATGVVDVDSAVLAELGAEIAAESHDGNRQAALLEIAAAHRAGLGGTEFDDAVDP